MWYFGLVGGFQYNHHQFLPAILCWKSTITQVVEWILYTWKNFSLDIDPTSEFLAPEHSA
jgi:hypothetical protein